MYGVIIIFAIVRAPWFRVLERESSNIYFAAIVLLLVFWNLNAGVMPGQSLHFLGASAVCLMFGWEFAFLAIQVLIVFVILDGRVSWDALAWNGLILGALPTLFTHTLLRFTQKRLPHNYFVYFFINTFLATILGVLLITLALGLLMNREAYPALTQGVLPFLAMLALPEGILTGMIISVLVIYKPQWVTTFRDKDYLNL